MIKLAIDLGSSVTKIFKIGSGIVLAGAVLSIGIGVL